MIGIIGGLGPFAGAYFFQTLLNKTEVESEVEHLPTLLISDPRIHDRSDFLLGKSDKNPAEPIIEKIALLKKMGATIIAIPCNQVFSPAIIDVIMSNEVVKDILVVNLIEALHDYIHNSFPTANKVGVLGRSGACELQIFNKTGGKEMVYLPSDLQNQLDEAIASKDFGMKFHISPITHQAKTIVNNCLQYFKSNNIDVVVLGCTELSLGVQQQDYTLFSFVDTNEVLAKTTINAFRSLKV